MSRFCTVLHSLQSPQNVGMIVRSHVAFGGDRVIMLGYEQPWRFGKGTLAFSRRLEKVVEFVYLQREDDLFSWCEGESLLPIALEISQASGMLDEYHFPERSALVVGCESTGLSDEFTRRCHAILAIPQFGAVGSLNVAVAASLAMYELNRGRRPIRPVEGTKYGNTGDND